jgi:ERCC4-type nuclease
VISVDDRVGSIDLATPLTKFGVKVRVKRLPFGDLAFAGNGPDNTLARVGIERKNVSDLMSSLQSGRLVGHQIPGMLDAFDYCYLLIEGVWRSEPGTGMLQVPGRYARGRQSQWVDQGFSRQRFYYAGLMSWLNTLVIQAGIIIVRTSTPHETCAAAAGLYRWWQKPWGDHKSLLPVLKTLQSQQRDPSKTGATLAISLTRVTTLRKILAQVPSIGWVRSAAVEHHFRSLRGALDGTEIEWQRIDGFGKTLAVRARRELGCNNTAVSHTAHQSSRRASTTRVRR